MARDFVPTTDAGFDGWLKNFAAQFADTGILLGFSPAELRNLETVAAEWEAQFTARLTADDSARAATANKRAARRNAVRLLRPFAKRVQAHPLTTDAIRSQLRLTLVDNPGGPGISLDATPLLRLNFGTRGQIKIHFGPNPANENRNALPTGAIGAVIQTRLVLPDAQGAAAEWDWFDNPSASPHTHLIQPDVATVPAYRCAYLYRKGRRGPWCEAAEAAVTP